MKTIRIIVLFAILVLQNVCLSQNIIPNGDFENDFTGWTASGTVNISNAVVHSGTKSFMASDTAKNRYSYRIPVTLKTQPFSLFDQAHAVHLRKSAGLQPVEINPARN